METSRLVSVGQRERLTVGTNKLTEHNRQGFCNFFMLTSSKRIRI